ncbi:MAG: hypothetical protein L0Y66_21025 [Myxococcaceae bacterium]|nr:hypothetical protein [Myxococcaceae bacterium]
MDARFGRWVWVGALAGVALTLGACRPERDRRDVASGGRGEMLDVARAEQWNPPAPAAGPRWVPQTGVGGAGMAGIPRGPGGSGEVVGTGAPPDGPLFGGVGRSDYVGPEPVITLPSAREESQPVGRGIQPGSVHVPSMDTQREVGGGQ